MDNSFEAVLEQGLSRLSLSLPAEAGPRLLGLVDLLLKWNEKVNLTAITRREEVLEKHIIDSLAVAPYLTQVQHLLDLGAGAGFPGLPLLLALPSLKATLVDAVAKKVAFMKVAAVQLGVAQRAQARHLRAQGHPRAEGLELVDCVISRAFMEPGAFLQLAHPYLLPQGQVVVMLGQTPNTSTLETLGSAAGFRLEQRHTFTLPFSGDARGVAVFRRST